MIYGSVPSYTVHLPVGPDYDNYTMEMFVRIADVYGAAVDFRIGIVQVIYKTRNIGARTKVMGRVTCVLHNS